MAYKVYLKVGEVEKNEWEYVRLGDMWIELGKYCTNSKGELSVHIPTEVKTKEEKIEKGEFRVLKIKKIEFENE